MFGWIMPDPLVNPVMHAGLVVAGPFAAELAVTLAAFGWVSVVMIACAKSIPPLDDACSSN